jgi:hypothetical protein
MTLTKCLAGVALVTGTILAACESSSGNQPNAAFGPDASFGDSGGARDSSSPVDSATRADASNDASPEAGGDPFSGVWQGMQLGATVEISNAAGCTLMKGSVNGVLCDECIGTYAADAGVASVVANCKPLGACSLSPPHTNTGTFTPIDGGLTFLYDYGGGSTSVDVQTTQGAPGDVCKIVDAGVD